MLCSMYFMLRNYILERGILMKRGNLMKNFFHGVCMGTFEVVPGISGGTLAVLLGIYEATRLRFLGQCMFTEQNTQCCEATFLIKF